MPPWLLRWLVRHKESRNENGWILVLRWIFAWDNNSVDAYELFDEMLMRQASWPMLYNDSTPNWGLASASRWGQVDNHTILWLNKINGLKDFKCSNDCPFLANFILMESDANVIRNWLGDQFCIWRSDFVSNHPTRAVWSHLSNRSPPSTTSQLEQGGHCLSTPRPVLLSYPEFHILHRPGLLAFKNPFVVHPSKRPSLHHRFFLLLLASVVTIESWLS